MIRTQARPTRGSGVQPKHDEVSRSVEKWERARPLGVTGSAHIDDDFAHASGEGHRDADHLRAGYTRYWADAGLDVAADELVYAIRFVLSGR